jgi:hypothetical protein
LTGTLRPVVEAVVLTLTTPILCLISLCIQRWVRVVVALVRAETIMAKPVVTPLVPTLHRQRERFLDTTAVPGFIVIKVAFPGGEVARVAVVLVEPVETRLALSVVPVEMGTHVRFPVLP